MGDVIRLNFNRGGFAGHTVENLMRQAAVLKCSRYERPDSSFSSKFGDLPHLPESAGWPICSGCGQPLTFIAQFNLPQLGLEAVDNCDLALFFYCFGCRPFWDRDGRGFFAGFYGADPLEKLLPEKKMFIDKSGQAPHVCRVSAVMRNDYPQASGARDLLVLDDAAAEEYLSRYQVIRSSKLGGWPAWKRLPDAPVCRHCGSEMLFFAQIASGEAHGLHFDGEGTLYLFRCAKTCRNDAFSLVIQDE